ncbi:hypothetical protein [Nocardia concava]|uniref:hypothetical protein n=1 Tax=Nocardia concava TaxID=257281 RepID=UPI000303D412|nr:hypothetical protein [Nocardia concava]
MSYVFTATHAVEFSEDGATPWAKFEFDSASSELVNGVTVKRYRFETGDAKIAARLRKVDDYGITELKATAKSDDDAETEK